MTLGYSVTMIPDPKVIAELRSLFKTGATPSRLVRHIVAEHGTTPDTDRLVRAYFREGFGVPMFRASASLLTLPPEALSFAGVNSGTVHQIVQHRAEWDTDGGTSWLDSLPPVAALNSGESTEAATVRYLSESNAILSRLVERLQAQVVALETERGDQRTGRIERAA